MPIYWSSKKTYQKDHLCQGWWTRSMQPSIKSNSVYDVDSACSAILWELVLSKLKNASKSWIVISHFTTSWCPLSTSYTTGYCLFYECALTILFRLSGQTTDKWSYRFRSHKFCWNWVPNNSRRIVDELEVHCTLGESQHRYPNLTETPHSIYWSFYMQFWIARNFPRKKVVHNEIHSTTISCLLEASDLL